MTQSNHIKLSVVIPTYNGAQRIHNPLQALISQDIDDRSIEIIIIDNASTDNTGEVARNYWSANAKDRNISFRIIREEKKGIFHARMRGILDARSPVICMIDDDNVPENDNYLKVGLSEFSVPSTGLVVSRIFPDYQSEITPSMQKREHLLAINNKLGDRRIEWDAEPSICPSIGAGLWFRRDVFLNAVPWQTPEVLSIGRTGDNFVSGEDIEIGYFIGRAGFKRIYSPDLRLRHLIPDRRLNTEYFRKLINGIVRSTLTLELKYNGRKFGILSKISAIAQLLFALFSAPMFVFFPDGVREFIFVISARIAKIQGPYPVTSANRSF